MTAPSPETREREKDKLWLTDAELIRRLGVPEAIARANLRALDANRLSGFPRRDPRWGNRRYWPDVAAYFDRVAVAKIPQSTDRRKII